jgi:glucose-6-phosphate 1-dehydrogenase
VNSPRWDKVPFTLRSGQALAADSAEIAICFRPLPRYLPGQWPGAEPNVLTVGLPGPWVRLSTTRTGPGRTAEIRQLGARPAAPRFPACAHPIRHMLNSDPMPFLRGDEAEEAWRIVDPGDERLVSRTSPCRGTQPAKRTMRSGLRKGRSPGPAR